MSRRRRATRTRLARARKHRHSDWNRFSKRGTVGTIGTEMPSRTAGQPKWYKLAHPKVARGGITHSMADALRSLGLVDE